MNVYLLAAILAVVEGLTEFLPVSSTAHIRLAQAVLVGHDSLKDPFWKLFAVVIQLPAVLAVVVYFRVKLLDFVRTFFAAGQTTGQRLRHPLVLIAVAFVVTAIPAALAKEVIKDNLESTFVMGMALLIGGVVMWIVDAYFSRRGHALPDSVVDADTTKSTTATVMPQSSQPAEHSATPPESPAAVSQGRFIDSVANIGPGRAAWIGAVQILSAIFPGTSRSMATIAAGQVAGLTRATALEFSFYLSIPIMFAAVAIDLYNTLRPGGSAYIGHALTAEELGCIAIGSVVSFVVALVVIAWFMHWVRRRGFIPFAIYRIIIGLVVLKWA